MLCLVIAEVYVNDTSDNTPENNVLDDEEDTKNIRSSKGLTPVAWALIGIFVSAVGLVMAFGGYLLYKCYKNRGRAQNAGNAYQMVPVADYPELQAQGMIR